MLFEGGFPNENISNMCVSLVSKVKQKKMTKYNWPTLPNKGNIFKIVLALGVVF